MYPCSACPECVQKPSTNDDFSNSVQVVITRYAEQWISLWASDVPTFARPWSVELSDVVRGATCELCLALETPGRTVPSIGPEKRHARILRRGKSGTPRKAIAKGRVVATATATDRQTGQPPSRGPDFFYFLFFPFSTYTYHLRYVTYLIRGRQIVRRVRRGIIAVTTFIVILSFFEVSVGY